MAIDSESLSEIHQTLALANLERLSQHEPPSRPEPDDSFTDNKELCNITLETLKRWSAKNAASIDTSIGAQSFNGKNNISWPIAFLPFMESMGMYLRDYSKLREAWQDYKAYKVNGANGEVTLKHCLDTYHAAYAPIRKLAQAWGAGMDFVPLCDLVHYPPDGHPHWDGPYCGAFFTTNAQKHKPFIGIAFKGTNPANLRDDLVDYNYQLTDAGKYLGGTRVSLGVFTALFSTFGDLGESTAYNYIVSGLVECVKKLSAHTTKDVRAHVTGHSLGGSYSSLFYAQFFQDAANVPIIPRDEYTFGAPRVGGQGWAIYNNDVVSSSKGQSWRVVNRDDLVPQVPATTLRPDELDFYHFDKGMRVFNDSVPQPIPTEIGLPPPPPVPFKGLRDLVKAVKKSTRHLPKSYYDSITYAINNAKSSDTPDP